MIRSQDPVLVIGGGWAGLAAAVSLAAAGCPVRVLEAARRPGGRARAVTVGGQTLDNGQHLMLGACRELLRLIELMGERPESLLRRYRLALPMRHRDGRSVTLRAAPLPAPLHLAAGLAFSRGLRWRDRIGALRLWSSLQRASNDGRALSSLTVAEALRQLQQPPALISWVWEPLCLAIMNTPAHEAAAGPFLATLVEALGGPADNADLLLPRGSLEAVFTTPALSFLRRHGMTVDARCRVEAIELKADRVAAVRVGGERLPAAAIVLAAGPSASTRLLMRSGLDRLAVPLARLEENTISTVYVRLRSPLGRPRQPLVGLLGTTAQWCFDRSDEGDTGLLAVVVSADPCRHSGRELAATIAGELKLFWPSLRIGDCLTVRERRATFRASPANEALRPAPDTPISGLWLAGDYTRTGLPATLEGAVRSGVTAAQLALAASPFASCSRAPR